MTESRYSAPQELVDRFFREEYARIVAVISRYFSWGELDQAEDIVQETLHDAIKHWEFKGIPPNPEAWLYKVAINKTVNWKKRTKNAVKAYQEISNDTVENELHDEESFSGEQITDSLVKMIFVCCHSKLSFDSQAVLILKTCCGFSIPEIASAFLSNKETINKRLVRARKTLHNAQIQLEINEVEMKERLHSVLHSIYLVFNEGYFSTTAERTIRYDICFDAIRLCRYLAEHPLFSDETTVHGLLALMYLNCSRLKSRETEDGLLVEMKDQDRSLYDQSLINKGLLHLEKIEESNSVSRYHLLAAISANHCVASTFNDTDWSSILKFYDKLLLIDDSPVVRLNRAIALRHQKGVSAGIEALNQPALSDPLQNYFPFQATLGSFYQELNEVELAKKHFKHALKLAGSTAQINTIKDKLSTL